MLFALHTHYAMQISSDMLLSLFFFFFFFFFAEVGGMIMSDSCCLVELFCFMRRIINTIRVVIQALYFAKEDEIWAEQSAQFIFVVINE